MTSSSRYSPFSPPITSETSAIDANVIPIDFTQQSSLNNLFKSSTFTASTPHDEHNYSSPPRVKPGQGVKDKNAKPRSARNEENVLKTTTNSSSKKANKKSNEENDSSFPSHYYSAKSSPPKNNYFLRNKKVPTLDASAQTIDFHGYKEAQTSDMSSQTIEDPTFYNTDSLHETAILKQQLKELQQFFAEKSAENEKHLCSVNELTTKLNSAYEKNSTLFNKWTEVKKQLSEQITANEELTEISKEIQDRIKPILEDKAQSLNDLIKDKEELSAKLEEAYEKNTSLFNKLNDAKKQISALKEETKDIPRLKNIADSYITKVTENSHLRAENRSLNTKTTHLIALSSNPNSSEKALNAYIECIKDADANITKKEEEIKTLKENAAQYERKLESLSNNLITIKSSRSKDAIDTATKEKLTEVTEMLTALQHEYRHLEDKFKAYRIEHARSNSASPIYSFDNNNEAVDNASHILTENEGIMPHSSNSSIKSFANITQPKTADIHDLSTSTAQTSNDKFLDAINQLVLRLPLPKNGDTQTTALNPRPALCKLEPTDFEGEPSTAIEWLRNFNFKGDNNGWSDDQKVRCAIAKMKKKAKEWVLDAFPDNNDPTLAAFTSSPQPSWQEFCQKFTDHFRPAGSEYVLEDQLKKLLKNRDETYTEYLIRFRNNAKRANALMPERKVIYLFKQSLKNDSILNIIANPNTMISIEEALRRYDDIKSIDRTVPQTKTKVFSRRWPQTKSANYTNTPTNKATDETPKQNRRSSAAPETLTCYNCANKGHTRRSYPEQENPKIQAEFRNYLKALKSGDTSVKKPTAAALEALNNEEDNVVDDNLDLFDNTEVTANDEPDILDEEEETVLPVSTILPLSCNKTITKGSKTYSYVMPLEIRITINSRPFVAMIDTGSVFSCISAKAFETLSPKPATCKWPYARLTSINGNDATPKRLTTSLAVKVENTVYWFKFAIIEDCCNSIVLGMDFLERSGALLSIKQRCIIFNTTRLLNAKKTANKPRNSSLPFAALKLVADDFEIETIPEPEIKTHTVTEKIFRPNGTNIKNVILTRDTLNHPQTTKSSKFTLNNNQSIEKGVINPSSKKQKVWIKNASFKRRTFPSNAYIFNLKPCGCEPIDIPHNLRKKNKKVTLLLATNNFTSMDGKIWNKLNTGPNRNNFLLVGREKTFEINNQHFLSQKDNDTYKKRNIFHDLSAKQKYMYSSLLENNCDYFTSPGVPFERSDVWKYHIITGDISLIHLHPFHNIFEIRYNKRKDRADADHLSRYTSDEDDTSYVLILQIATIHENNALLQYVTLRYELVQNCNNHLDWKVVVIATKQKDDRIFGALYKKLSPNSATSKTEKVRILKSYFLSYNTVRNRGFGDLFRLYTVIVELK